MEKGKLEGNEKKEKEKTKWGEFVTPVFMSCYDTLCHDLVSPPGDTCCVYNA